MAEIIEKTVYMPLLPLRGLNVFPQMVITFEVERNTSVNAVNTACGKDGLIFLTAQKDAMQDLPESSGLYKVGTVCKIKQHIILPQSSVCRVMVEGLYRAEAIAIHRGEKLYTADIFRIDDKKERVSAIRREALVRNTLSLFRDYSSRETGIPGELLTGFLNSADPAYISDYIGQHSKFSLENKQELLELNYPYRRLALLIKILNEELNIMDIEARLNEETQARIDKDQKNYYLRQELKAIKDELGEDEYDDDDEYIPRINALPVSDEIKSKLIKEAKKLAKEPFGSSEASVIKSYLDICLDMPWDKKCDEILDIPKVKKMLDDDHYGLEKVKTRIIEYLSVKKLTPDAKGGLICLVGPPGTGKTSVALSIAKCLNRRSVRIALGGVHDEAEIRGHRKTYVGSMPGRIINGIISAGVSNPLMILDEIDKLGSDYRGDPSSALLEVLDPEQNCTFRDNFLEIPFDLSDVFFITTANTTSTIPRPLLDRMEVIELSSYTDEEKLSIAKLHLLNKQRKKHGLATSSLRVSDAALRSVISDYTRESGVRELERSIAAVCRKAASEIASGDKKTVSVTAKNLDKYLGVPKYKDYNKNFSDEVGLVHGLAYTSVGGEVLDVEAAVMDGSGKLQITGNLGKVMEESVKAAVTCIRTRSAILKIDPDFHKNCDIHIHFPEGAVPKDGPSAGITICMALTSALTGSPANANIAMTGEISLRGRVMPIGGLKEKSMAAYRYGIRTILIPEGYVPNLEEIDNTVRENVRFIPIKTVDDAFPFVFGSFDKSNTKNGTLSKAAAESDIRLRQ